MEVKLSQVGLVDFFAPVSLFSLVGHLPCSKVPHRLMEVPIGYCGGVVGFMVFATFWSSRLLTGSLSSTEEPSGSLCHFKSLARTSLSKSICKVTLTRDFFPLLEKC